MSQTRPAGSNPVAARLQRSCGRVRLGFKQNSGRTELAELYQQGCSKVRFPLVATGAPMESILINTAGGLTDADELHTRVSWQPGTKAMVTSQAAERIYLSRGQPARISTELAIAEDATACWMPQETIVFDGGRVDRRLNVELQGNASLFAAEILVFGRAAMGERMQSGSILDRWLIRVDGNLVFADSSALDDQLHNPLHHYLEGTAIGLGSIAAASLILVSRNCDEHLKSIRSVIEAAEVIGGASSLGPLLTIRLLATGSAAIRAATLDIFKSIYGSAGFAVPRVWTC